MQNLPSKNMAVAKYVLFKKSFTLHKRLVQFFEYLSHNSCGQRKRAFFFLKNMTSIIKKHPV